MTPADLAAALAAGLAPALETIRAAIREDIRAAIREAGQAAEPRWLTVARYSEVHAIAPCTVRAAIKSGRLAAERWGRTWRIRSDSQIAPPPPRPADLDTPTVRVDELLARPRRRRGGGQ